MLKRFAINSTCCSSCCKNSHMHTLTQIQANMHSHIKSQYYANILKIFCPTSVWQVQPFFPLAKCSLFFPLKFWFFMFRFDGKKQFEYFSFWVSFFLSFLERVCLCLSHHRHNKCCEVRNCFTVWLWILFFSDLFPCIVFALPSGLVGLLFGWLELGIKIVGLTNRLLNIQ